MVRKNKSKKMTKDKLIKSATMAATVTLAPSCRSRKPIVQLVKKVLKPATKE